VASSAQGLEGVRQAEAGLRGGEVAGGWAGGAVAGVAAGEARGEARLAGAGPGLVEAGEAGAGAQVGSVAGGVAGEALGGVGAGEALAGAGLAELVAPVVVVQPHAEAAGVGQCPVVAGVAGSAVAGHSGATLACVVAGRAGCHHRAELVIARLADAGEAATQFPVVAALAGGAAGVGGGGAVLAGGVAAPAAGHPVGVVVASGTHAQPRRGHRPEVHAAAGEAARGVAAAPAGVVARLARRYPRVELPRSAGAGAVGQGAGGRAGGAVGGTGLTGQAGVEARGAGLAEAVVVVADPAGAKAGGGVEGAVVGSAAGGASGDVGAGGAGVLAGEAGGTVVDVGVVVGAEPRDFVVSVDAVAAAVAGQEGAVVPAQVATQAAGRAEPQRAAVACRVTAGTGRHPDVYSVP
jgi:hypothetical protein